MPQTRHLRPSQVFPHILQNSFRAIGHRTAHRPLCHEYLAPDRTTFSGLSSFYTVLWHITLKAICKITEFLTCLKHATSGHPKFSLTFCKTPSGRSATEPPTGHFVMNISPPIARLFQAYRHSTLFCGTLLWKRFVKISLSKRWGEKHDNREKISIFAKK